MMHYLCPPKLQTKFLLMFWTVPEILVAAALVIMGAYIWYGLIVLGVFIAIMTARINLEHNISGKIYKMVRYYYRCKTAL